MRPVCDGCGTAQAPDWSPGERCVQCGGAVRADVRCFWCAKWTPPGKFCRACGADVVEPRVYGAARMLKEAGTDRFTVPKLLAEFDPERLEHFSRLYQRQRAVVLRHVDDLRFVERFLLHRGFADALEEELIPRLPMGDEALGALALEPRPPGDDLPTLGLIQTTSPFDRTRRLAALARVRLDDWTAAKDAAAALHDPALAPEAALVLTGWRVRAAGLGKGRDPAVRKLLETSDLKVAAAARLGLDGDADRDLLRQALAADDPETAFTAALALGDIDRLVAALSSRDELVLLAAGRRLAALGVFAPLEPVLRSGSEDLSAQLVLALHAQKRPAPELKAALLDLVEKKHPQSVRAAGVLARACDGTTALRLAKATGGDHQVVQALLRDEAGLDLQAVGDLIGWLAGSGAFRKGQWGLDQALARGVVDRGLAERLFPSATDAMKIELIGLAEKQLDDRDDDAVRRFLLNVVFGPHDAKVRAAAAWALRRNARRDGPRGAAFPPLDRASVERWFGPVADFGRRLAAVLADDPSLREVGLYDELTTFLKSLDDGLAPELGNEALMEALLGVAGGDYSGFVGDAATEALGKLGADPRWRPAVLLGLEAIGKRGNYTMDRALRRLHLSEHGLPEEREWPSLPLDTAPSRFAQASEEGRRELLKLADQQLLKHPDAAGLLDFLGDVAFGPWPAGLRLEAARIRDNRSRAGWAFAPERTAGLLLALRDPQFFTDDRFRRILATMLEGTSDDPDLAEACLDLAERPEAESGLRRKALGFAVRGRGVRVLERLRALRCDGLLKMDRDRALRELEPPPPEPDEEPDVPPVNSPPRPDPAVYAAKAREAERLGRELQEACLKISFGPLSAEEKTREIMRLQDEFRARIQSIYGM